MLWEGFGCVLSIPVAFCLRWLTLHILHCSLVSMIAELLLMVGMIAEGKGVWLARNYMI